ncbi:MAG TPA: CHAT domain-containing protein [Polyangium sp.]|nr:CHAT domain-containing protein [Polyangium sp.]
MRFRRAVASIVTLVVLASAAPTFAAPPLQKAPATPLAEAKVPPEATKLIDEAIAKAKAQKFFDAIDTLNQAITIIEKKHGPDHYLLGNALNILTQIETIVGRLDDAEKHAERAIAVLKKDVNADPMRLGYALIRRAELYGKRGKVDEEVELRKLTIKLFDKAFGSQSTATLAEILHLAQALRHWGRYDDAKTYFEYWNSTIARMYSNDDPIFMDVLLDYGMNEAEAGRYDDAEKIFLRALDVSKKHGRIKDQDIESILNGLAEVKYQQGDYAAAEALYERVRAVFEADQTTSRHEMGILLGNLGSVRMDRGDVQGGMPLLRQSLDLLEQHFGQDNPEIVSALTNLGEALLRQRKFDECKPYLERALAIREKAFGPDHPRLANQLINLGSVWLEQRDNARGEPYFQRALAIQEKKLGATNPLLFPTLQALGFIEQGKNRLDQAEAYHKRAIEVLEKSFGPTHPNIPAPLRSLAAIQRLRGNLDASRGTLERASEIAEKNTTRMLASGSEAQKLAWLSTLDPLWEQIIEHHMMFEPKNEAAARLALNATLRRKGRALDAVAGSLSLLRRNMSPEVQAIFEQLREKQKKLASMMMHANADKDPAAWTTELLALEKDVAQLEDVVSSKSAAYRLETQTATVDAVQKVLPEDAMYVEIIRRRLANLGYFAPGTTEQYAVYVLGPKGSPRVIDLGDAGPIDDAVFKLRDALAEPSRKDVKALSRALDEKVMRPVRAALGSSKRLILAPDGNLNFIPFEALVDENDKFLIERWSISYVTSGRDLFRWSRHAPSRSAPVVVANPKFGEIVKRPAGEGGSNSRGVDKTGISRLGFTPLSGTEEEGRAILKQLSGAQLRAGGDAKKQSVTTLAGPKILHIATHGFFLGDSAETAAANTRGFTLEGEPPPPVLRSLETEKPKDKPSPLLLSGLALSGANAHGQARADGILTALEASGLDLEGTKLVVLSACETGLGQARSGEGVEGLRRAFVLAGAETTVMSLWKVDDTATRDMMIGYYKRIEGGEGRSEALRQVRLQMLAQDSTAHPFYWASFIVAGDPSRLDGTMPSVPSVTPSARGCACVVAGEIVENDPQNAGFLIVALGAIGVWRRRRLS